MKQKIIIAGGSGFLGTALARHFATHGDEVTVLTRSPKPRADGVREIGWDTKTIGDWAALVDGADVVLNLNGRSVDCRYTKKNRRAMMASRIDSTRVIGEAIARAAKPPRVWLNASSATLYKHHPDRPADETGPTGATPEAHDAFSIEIIREWERTLDAAHTPHTRKLALRTAMVFGPDASVFPVLRRLTRLGLGGKMGSGQQFVSWIHHEDFCRAVEWLIDRDDLSGPINLAAPNPLTNAEMMQLMRKTCGAPAAIQSAGKIAERATSPPSPPRSGGEGRGEVVLRVQGGMQSLVFNFMLQSMRRFTNNAFSNYIDRHFKSHPGVPFGLPATAWMLEIGAFFLRTETELILKSRRVVPGKLLASGFQFHFPTLENALRDLHQQNRG